MKMFSDLPFTFHHFLFQFPAHDRLHPKRFHGRFDDMMPQIMPQVIKLFTANNGIHNQARHDDKDNWFGIFWIGHREDF
jgi:hypothetical protein